jgi:acyl-CoA oxidase
MGTKAANQTGPEMKVLDYGTQQAALLPLLASAYSLHFTGQYMLQLYKEVTAQIKAGDFTQLPELHATSAGLKAFCTWMSAYGIEECRQRCGGHGFLRSSALPDLFAATVPACTYEGMHFQHQFPFDLKLFLNNRICVLSAGDNLVLLQQTARYLFKALKGFQLGKAELTGNIAYLKLASKIDNDSCPVASAADLLKPEVQLAIYRHKAVRAILTVGMKLEEELKQRGNFPETWNWMMSDFKVVVKAHTYLIMLEAFTRAVAATQDAAIRAVLKRLCDLFALYNLEQDISTVLVDGYFAGTHGMFLAARYSSICVLSNDGLFFCTYNSRLVEP